LSNSAVKGGLATVIVLVVAIVLGLAVGEAVIRVKNADMRNYDIEMWRYSNELKVRSEDPQLSHIHRKNASAVLQSVTIRTDEWGLRGAPVAELPPGGRRILFLGASITLGWGVAEEDTVTQVLQRRLSDSGEKAQVLNAGIGNYNAPRYARLFLTQLKDLQPTDIVVHYFLRDAESLDAGGGDWLLRNSELAMTMWIAWTRVQARFGESDIDTHYRSVYRPDTPGYRDMERALGEIAAYSRQRGIRVYLAIVPDVHNLENYKLGDLHRQVAALAEGLGYKVVDLLPAFGKLQPREVWAMPGDPHPNALGHKIMADALFPLLHADAAAK